MKEEANDRSQSCTVKKCGFFRQALPLTMQVIKCVLIFLLLVGEWGGPIPPQSLLYAYTPLMLTDRPRNLLFATRASGCLCGLCWSRVIPTSHLPWTKGDVVEHETWHSQMSDTCTQEIPSPTAVSIHCVGRLSHGYDITSIQLLHLILGSCWSYI